MTDDLRRLRSTLTGIRATALCGLVDREDMRLRIIADDAAQALKPLPDDLTIRIEITPTTCGYHAHICLPDFATGRDAPSRAAALRWAAEWLVAEAKDMAA